MSNIEMNGIELMIDEHKYIKRMLKVLRNASSKLLKGETPDFDDFYKMIDFVKTYADDHHHGKEEKLLFNRMSEELGDTGKVIINNGMLVEHDMGRFHMAELRKALEELKNGSEEAKIDIIASAVGYANLLSRHIDKEDNVVYSFAERELSKETLDEVNLQCQEFEVKQMELGIQDKYMALVDELERKYS